MGMSNTTLHHPQKEMRIVRERGKLHQNYSKVENEPNSESMQPIKIQLFIAQYIIMDVN